MNEREKLKVPALIDLDWQRVCSVLPADAEQTVRPDRALLRRRKVASALDLLRIVLLYALCDGSLPNVGLPVGSFGMARLPA